jgi:hypothetical protein
MYGVRSEQQFYVQKAAGVQMMIKQDLRNSRYLVNYCKLFRSTSPVLPLTEHHAMKAYWGVEVQFHPLFDLGTRRR